MRQPPEQRKADAALALPLAHEPGALFEVAERYSPSRIADAVTHVSQAGGPASSSSISRKTGRPHHKFGTIGAGTVALAFTREALATGDWPRSSVEQPTRSKISCQLRLPSLTRGVRGYGRGGRKPRLCPARRSLAKCRGRAARLASVERPSTHRRNKSVRRVQPAIICHDELTDDTNRTHIYCFVPGNLS